MSSVHPPGSPVPLRKPWAAKAPTGFGQVVALAGMNWSIRNGEFLNALVALQLAVSGGTVRLTSFCGRQASGAPAWSTWVVCAWSAFDSPSTPSQPPYRLSKLWFSS